MNQSILMNWQVDFKVDELRALKADLKNINVFLGKTEEEQIKCYLTCHENMLFQKNGLNYERILEEDLEDNIYSFEFDPYKTGRNPGLSFYHLYILVPEDYKGQLEIDLKNGNLVSLSQRNDLKIEARNVNVIVSDYQEQNLDCQLKNGNLIFDYQGDLNAELIARVKNGVMIGFQPPYDRVDYTDKKSRQIFGEGLYRLNFDVVNGNIISK